MNTRQRMQALRRSSVGPMGMADAGSISEVLEHPACVIGSGQSCEHPLVDRDLNRLLFDYERTVRSRFTRIVEVLKRISTHQHDENFTERAQQLAREQLGFDLPSQMFEDAWVCGLDLSALHSHCIFSVLKSCVENARTEQAGWRQRMPLDENFLRSCGYHTVDISPCSDGRLQGMSSYVLRILPGPNVQVKAYAGALFDIEVDVCDWAQREVERLSGAMVDGERLNYLKIAVYHFSSSSHNGHGCAAHGSNDRQATESALGRLDELREAIDRSFGVGAAPDVLLIGVDTDLDALRIHLPDSYGDVNSHRYIETVRIYRETLGLSDEAARACIAEMIADVENTGGWGQGQGRMHDGMRRLVSALAEANLSQIEYVIKHHTGRYATIGHDEECIVAGDAVRPLQLRNLFYFAHLDTIEEGAPDIDVGIDIFAKLNIAHGLPVPVLVHFEYDARIPESRARAVARGRRVRDAIRARYPDLAARGLLNCAIAVSERAGDECCDFVADEVTADH
ncbi:carboxysome shell carbonic anhydrase [Nitrosomonas eutropha]|uniref:Carboxysome shell carbonic anhydrase n=1 Tax=Nitrosomonas eutropha TaxID=916 RepID=A0A1I7J8R0_9PROT|nr:carboxysome shell carbonic anhydrase [Nitrosomonas eutropha]SFU81600.1 carboxysome shell carbonic anhydrase [Nitrosomonas eutropha]